MRIIVPMLTYSLLGFQETSGLGENPSGKELKVMSGQHPARNLGSQSNNPSRTEHCQSSHEPGAGSSPVQPSHETAAPADTLIAEL